MNDNSEIEDLDCNLKNQFVTAANTLTQFYMTSMQQQKKAFNCGVRKTVERIQNMILNNSIAPDITRQGTSRGSGRVISVDLLMNFLNQIIKETQKEDKGKNIINPSRTSDPPMPTPQDIQTNNITTNHFNSNNPWNQNTTRSQENGNTFDPFQSSNNDRNLSLFVFDSSPSTVHVNNRRKRTQHVRDNQPFDLTHSFGNYQETDFFNRESNFNPRKRHLVDSFMDCSSPTGQKKPKFSHD